MPISSPKSYLDHARVNLALARFEGRTRDLPLARRILDAALNRSANEIADLCGCTRDRVIGTLAAARAYYGRDYVIAVRGPSGVMRYTYGRP